MQAPSNFDGFDFSFPLGAYGNSSGWLDEPEFSLKRQPDLSPRRLTVLSPVGTSLFFPMEDGQLRPPRDTEESDLFTFAHKVPLTPENLSKGEIGVGSGGGSAIVRRGGRAYKIKRCGLADRGFVDEPFDSHMSLPRDGEHFELTRHAMGGLMSLADVFAECRMTHQLHAEGLSTAYRVVGAIIVSELPESPYPNASVGAVVVEVGSDLRMDEVVHMALSPMLAELFSSGRLRYDARSGFFDAQRIPQSQTLKRWSSLFERMEALGLSAGSTYRRVHRAGYLRGIGSAWFGNEVVDAQGEVSVVDFDGGTTEAAPFEAEVAARLRRVEFQQYCSESYTFLSDMRPRSLSCFGAAFIDAFQRGYEEPYRPVPRDLLREIIDDHLAVLPVISEGFGFPVDMKYDEAAATADA